MTTVCPLYQFLNQRSGQPEDEAVEMARICRARPRDPVPTKAKTTLQDAEQANKTANKTAGRQDVVNSMPMY